MKKPEIVATAGSMDELRRVIGAGADAVAIGEHRYGLRLSGEFRLPQLADAAGLARDAGVKVYAMVNRIMDNELAGELPDYLNELGKIGPDAIVFGDPAVVMAMRQLDLRIPPHWDGEMTARIMQRPAFWGAKGAVRAVLARELNLDKSSHSSRTRPWKCKSRCTARRSFIIPAGTWWTVIWPNTGAGPAAIPGIGPGGLMPWNRNGRTCSIRSLKTWTAPTS